MNNTDLTTGINGIEALREAVAWLDSRPECLNENKSPEELLSEWYKVSGGMEEEDASLIDPAFGVGDIVTITGNRPDMRHYLELGEICRVVKLYSLTTGGVEVSPLGVGELIQIVHPNDLRLNKPENNE